MEIFDIQHGLPEVQKEHPAELHKNAERLGPDLGKERGGLSCMHFNGYSEKIFRGKTQTEKGGKNLLHA